MTEMGWEFVSKNRQDFGGTLGAALAEMVGKRWPKNTAKMVASAWDLDESTAQNLTKGHASERTIAKAIRAEGWDLLAPLGTALTGRTYEQHLQSIIEETELARQRLASRRDRVRDLEARAASLVAMGVRMASE